MGTRRQADKRPQLSLQILRRIRRSDEGLRLRDKALENTLALRQLFPAEANPLVAAAGLALEFTGTDQAVREENRQCNQHIVVQTKQVFEFGLGEAGRSVLIAIHRHAENVCRFDFPVVHIAVWMPGVEAASTEIKERVSIRIFQQLDV